MMIAAVCRNVTIPHSNVAAIHVDPPRTGSSVDRGDDRDEQATEHDSDLGAGCVGVVGEGDVERGLVERADQDVGEWRERAAPGS